jgi:phosphate transport system substrate-binding protein
MRSVAFLLLAAMAGAVLTAQTTIRIGTVAGFPAIFDPIRAHLEKDTGLKLAYLELGAVDSFQGLQAGKLDIAVAASSMESWLELMQSKGVKVKAAFAYRHCSIGQDGLSVLVNPDVLTDASMLVSDLDRATIKKIFLGTIRNWKEVGGPDLPITVVLWNKNQVTNKEFREKALDGEPYAPNHTMLTKDSYRDLLEFLGKTKGSVGIGPLAITKSSKIWSPEQAPKVQRPITMLVADHPTPEMAKAVATLLAYIQGPGKQYIP